MSQPARYARLSKALASTLTQFKRDGFVVLHDFTDGATIQAMLSKATSWLKPLQAPVEFEVDVGYPGAPASRSSAGGKTPRRLLQVYARDALFSDWPTQPAIGELISRLMPTATPMLSLSHHNCVMTKHPGFSSATHWHQDIRYWSFDRPELISVWLALGEEFETNGALQVIPGSHLLNLDRDRLDDAQFLRPELDDNRKLIAQAEGVRLHRGDLLVFHCRLLHAAGTNRTDSTKYSLVFTYHASENAPQPKTRSASYPSIPVY